MQFEVNGDQVEVADEGLTLLEVLRDQLGLTSVKDGCSPQGQCGCCTVLVDGEPRVSCVTPARRVVDRAVTTLEGLDAAAQADWSNALCATGGSQCGFCTPGIIVRLESMRERGGDLSDRDAVNRSLAAHLCRCTGWQTIVEAAVLVVSGGVADTPGTDRDLDAATRRAAIEGRTAQVVTPEVSLGQGGFADDGAPVGTPIGIRGPEGDWVLAASLTAARREVGKVQGRRSTVEVGAPVELPEGDWVATLQTGWVDSAYLETDSSCAAPKSEPSNPLANGGAFGGKSHSPLPEAAARVAQATGETVRLRWSREDSLRFGPKRPPVAIGIAGDGTGSVRVARTPGIVGAIAAMAPDWSVEEVDVAGPPTSADLRAAGWAEVAAVRGALSAGEDGTVTVTSPDGATAQVRIDSTGAHVTVRCGEVLDAIVLRSYCIGAVHMALGWVTSETLATDDDGNVVSLSIRSLGIVRPGDMIDVTVEIIDEPGGEPVNGSDAVFAATAGAVWVSQGLPAQWPTGMPIAR